MTRTFIIAVDGPAAAGKGTLAKKLAARMGADYLDTGSLYRAVALAVHRGNLDIGDQKQAQQAAENLDTALLNSPDLRSEAIASKASIIASYQGVRAALLDFQRDFAAHPPTGRGAILDGRDVGTAVCPHADVKLYVTASVEARAERRWKEIKAKGEPAAFEDILADVKARDARDTARTAAPLKPADDAHLLDTTNLDIEAAFDRAQQIIRSVIAVQ